MQMQPLLRGGHPTSATVSSSSVSGDVRREGAAGRIKEAGAPPRRSLSSMLNSLALGSADKKQKIQPIMKGEVSQRQLSRSSNPGAGAGGIVI